MKRIFNYILPLLTLALAVSCSEQICETGGTEGTGTLSMRITATRAETDAYDPMSHLVVSIFNKDGGLIRRYRAQENLPARLELLAGDYRVEVEAGEKKPASFTARFYKGEKTFTVTAGAVTPIEVRCNIQNVTAEAKFDKTVTDNFGTQFHAWIVAADSFVEQDAVQNKVPALKYTTDATGYFTNPEGVTSLAWAFHGEHPNSKYGTIDKKGVLENIQTPGKYVLTFKFSPDLPGYIEAIPIRVDTSTDDEDDTVVFSPDPILEGVDFDAEALQRYTSGEKVYTVAAMESINVATLKLQDKTYDLLSATPIEGITVERTTPTDLRITLADAFFADRAAGDHTLKFHFTDTDGGELLTETPYRFEGLLPVLNEHCDLWKNSVVLRYVAFGDSVSFSLREKDGEWQTTAGEKKDNDIFVATYAAEWTKKLNDANLEVYTQTRGTGVRAAHSYEYKAIAAGIESPVAAFTTAGGDIIPGGDMEDGSMNCFNNHHGTFWDSGNNSMADLCEQSTYNGMEGAKCAKLKASKPIALVKLAAGNLFTGSFEMATPNGIVYFGQKYDWTARPTALSVRYFANIGKVNEKQHAGAPLNKDDPDQARIFVAIIDWDERHYVKSGSGAPEGVWDPATMSSINSKKIIAYGSLFIEGKTEGDSMVEVSLPIEYYDTVTKPSGNYTLVISCATSAYGDYMTGCTTNVMYVDDFKWVY